MRTELRHPLALLAILAFPAAAQADGHSATANGAATAQIVAPLTVTRVSDLDFGTIFASAAPGVVTVSPEGSASYGGGVHPACAGADCASPHAAAFAVRGEPDRSYAIVVPARIVANGTSSDPGDETPPDIAVNDIALRTDSRPADGASGQLGRTGADRFTIGGTLEIPAGLRSSRYRATIAITINYI